MSEKTIVVNDRGIFLQSTKVLTPRAVSGRRKRIQDRIIRCRREIQDFQFRINETQNRIADLEKQLQVLNSPMVEQYLVDFWQEQEIIQRKAENLLHEMIGDESFKILRESKRLIFSAKDGQQYRLEWGGKIYRKDGKNWKQLCIIRPSNLPVPDFVLALLVNVKDHPSRYPLRRR